MLKRVTFFISFFILLYFGNPKDQPGNASTPLHENNNETPMTRTTEMSKEKREMKETGEVWDKGMCYSCFAKDNDTTKQYNDCLNAVGFFETCPRRQCYTEFNPSYVKRGCLYYNNKTFYCNDLLCNNKPAEDISLYAYETLRNWKQDNEKLREQRGTYCKSCKTIGFGKHKDTRCEIGESADHEKCRSDQVCFTNIDESTRYITRGCANAPVYNSIYFYCNENACNNRSYTYYEHLQTLNIKEMFPTVKSRNYLDSQDDVSAYLAKKKPKTKRTKKNSERLGGNGYTKMVTIFISLTMNMFV